MFTDTYHSSLDKALAESARRRASPEAAGTITRVEPSPYRGYRVRTIPADWLVDHHMDGGLLGGRSPHRLFGAIG